VLRDRDSELEHYEYLGDGNENPVPELLKNLNRDIGTGGTVIVWNKSFEMSRNKEMAKMYPDYADFLHSVNERVFYLM